ncbi:unnamed protein product [Cuscuta campestris]|uniref:Uncharacterized protein n=1 Tax=Cuscuta campestris TaxID=132261 RepID=A0A484MVM9_9ASTE|nr:unnamed protein product [Cuscuta campestris]
MLRPKQGNRVVPPEKQHPTVQRFHFLPRFRPQFSPKNTEPHRFVRTHRPYRLVSFVHCLFVHGSPVPSHKLADVPHNEKHLPGFTGNQVPLCRVEVLREVLPGLEQPCGVRRPENSPFPQIRRIPPLDGCVDPQGEHGTGRARNVVVGPAPDFPPLLVPVPAARDSRILAVQNEDDEVFVGAGIRGEDGFSDGEKREGGCVGERDLGLVGGVEEGELGGLVGEEDEPSMGGTDSGGGFGDVCCRVGEDGVLVWAYECCLLIQ